MIGEVRRTDGEECAAKTSAHLRFDRRFKILLAVISIGVEDCLQLCIAVEGKTDERSSEVTRIVNLPSC